MDWLRGRTLRAALKEDLFSVTRVVAGRRRMPIEPPELSTRRDSTPEGEQAADQTHVDAVPRLDRPRS